MMAFVSLMGHRTQKIRLHVGFDMGEPMGLWIGYAEVICYKFGLLDT